METIFKLKKPKTIVFWAATGHSSSTLSPSREAEPSSADQTFAPSWLHMGPAQPSALHPPGMTNTSRNSQKAT